MWVKNFARSDKKSPDKKRKTRGPESEEWAN